VSTGHIWRAALDRLRGEMTRAQFDTWLRGAQLAELGAADGVAVLQVRTTFARELLETRFRERIEAAIAEVSGRPCVLRVVVADVRGEDGVATERGAPLTASRAAGALTTATHRSAARTSSAGYGGPTLFAGEGEDREHVATQARPRRPPPPAGMRPRTGAGARRTAPSRERVRAALERAGDALPVTTGVPGRGTPAVDAREPTRLGARRGRDEEGEGKTMDERSDPRAQREPPPTMTASPGWDGRDVRGAAPGEPPAGGAGGGAVPIPRLNPRYTFSTFIVGSGNQLAHAASQAVAEAPGQAYNPLFLYGGVGLGKTHLLHAIGHKALAMGLSVLYVSSETFTNEIINAIRYRTQEEFRDKYRSVDTLLVDDIQFIAGKESTEEEFFHTFNSLYEMSKQIVICSDRPPKAIISLEERLRSRFEWGLIADIQPPDLETRVAILRAKADMLGRVVPDDVITYLAGRVQSNIRELEGSFNRLLAYSQLQGLPLTAETAKSALASIASDGRQRRVSVGEVLAAVAEYYRIPEDDLRGKQRDKHIVVPRQVAMYLMRQETEASLLEIGQSLGGRDHSTVLHGCEKIGREMNENTSLRKEVLAIRQQLLG
jgi:chromosomal replication initiator protein DnaA